MVTPPGPIGEFDPVRLLSAANVLATTSFWPGGLQVLVGNTALVPDSIQLLPLPDSVLLAMEQGQAPVRVETPVVQVSLVPLLSREGRRTGAWVAAWNVFPGLRVGTRLRLLFLGSALGIVLTGVLGMPALRSSLRWVTAAGGAVALVLLVMTLTERITTTVRAATELRLEALRRLVEMAATAPGVRQATVPDVAASAEVRPLARAPAVGSALAWDADSAGPFATITAATPRTLSGLALTLRPVDPDPIPILAQLRRWCGIGLAGLLVTALFSGLSPVPAVFHSGESATPSSTSGLA